MYLDTNVVYAALGLASPHEAISTLRLLDLTRELGYDLAVTPWTVAELRWSLRAARRRVQRRPLPRRELADLLARESDDSIVAAFWAAYRDKGTHPNDFFEFHEHFDVLLEGHGVRIVDEGVVAVEQSRTAIEAQLVLLGRHKGGAKGDAILEHDVKHRLLIERLRGHGNIRFTNARYWFLTRDGKLPPYALTTSDGSSVQLPFCVATSAWLQVMRSFVPRTEDLDKTIVDLLASPCIPVIRRLPAWVIEEVVGRVDQYENADERLASEVLADTALVADIERAGDDNERRRRVDRALERKTAELGEKLDAAQELAAQSRRDAADARRMAQEHEDRLELERRQLRILEGELERERHELERERRERLEATSALEAQLAKAEVLRRSAEARAEQRQVAHDQVSKSEIEAVRNELVWFKHVVVGVLTVLGAVCAIAAAAVLISLRAVTAPGLVVMLVCAAIGAALLAARVLLGKRRGNRLAVILTGAATIIGFVWFVYDKATEKPAPPVASPRAIVRDR